MGGERKGYSHGGYKGLGSDMRVALQREWYCHSTTPDTGILTDFFGFLVVDFPPRTPSCLGQGC